MLSLELSIFSILALPSAGLSRVLIALTESYLKVQHLATAADSLCTNRKYDVRFDQQFGRRNMISTRLLNVSRIVFNSIEPENSNLHPAVVPALHLDKLEYCLVLGYRLHVVFFLEQWASFHELLDHVHLLTEE